MQSTLILSRKDGSIIKATGSIIDSIEVDSHHHRRYGNIEAVTYSEETDRGVQDSQDENLVGTSTEQTASPAQILAESIYAFVSSAEALAESLEKLDVLAYASKIRSDSGRAGLHKEDHNALNPKSQVDGEIQLLRLRLKKQEVIIFPDPQYLCCVVQDLDKNVR